MYYCSVRKKLGTLTLSVPKWSIEQRCVKWNLSWLPSSEHQRAAVWMCLPRWLKHFPIEVADPVEAIKFRMDQRGLTIKDLEPMIGRSNRVYEELNRIRPLPLPKIWKLHRGLGILAEALIQPPKFSPSA
jgi:antitoxin component HigA of HigAB toxin-antitoxin module